MGNGIIFGAAMAEKKQENGASEVFGCIPHGARAYRERTSLPWGLTPLYSKY